MEFKIRTLKDEEISQQKQELDIKKKRLNLEETIDIIKQLDKQYLVEELAEDGVGYLLYEQLEKGMEIYADELIRWVFTTTRGQSAINRLEQEFKSI